MTSDDKTLKRAQDRYKIAKDAWSDVYSKATDDLQFQSDEPFAQWDKEEATSRTRVKRPVLTIDQLGQFVHQVVNDIRMNTPSINVLPDGDGADVETSEIYQGLIKAIEYNSQADVAYDTAVDFSVKSSIGFIRVDHGYTASTGFDQELLIKRVVNPQSILLDPDSIEPDGSDAKYAFALEEVDREQFIKDYPDATPVSFGDTDPNKTRQDDKKLTIAEYFEIIETTTNMGLTDSGDTEEVDEKKKYKTTRKQTKCTIKRTKLSGEDVLEETTFPGIYIPLVPVYGEEQWIQGKRNLNSLIRKSKEAQYMYNLWKSLETELLLKQQQAPVQAAVGQMEGFEDDWKTPDKAMVLYYNQKDVNGDPAPPPQRLQPPTIPTGIVNAARETVDDIKATMGMYSASIGQRSNETSGIAINSRKKEGDVATYHFGDNLTRSIAQVGKIIVFAIPGVYTGPRIIKIVGQEDEIKMIAINGAKPTKDQKRAFDLNQGKFNVRVVTGPSFTTQRQEAAQQYTQLIQAMPDLMPVIGDLVFKYQDTPGSQAISARLKKTIDPKFLDEESPEAAQVKQLQGQLQQMGQAAQQEIQQLQAQLANKDVDNKVKLAETEIKQEEADIKKGELKLKIFQTLNADGTQKTESTEIDEVPFDDSSVEMLQAKIQQKLQQKQESESAKQIASQQAEAQQAEMAQAIALKQQQDQADKQMKDAQAMAVIQSLDGIQQTLGALTTQISQPIQVIRDEQGNITGAA